MEERTSELYPLPQDFVGNSDPKNREIDVKEHEVQAVSPVISKPEDKTPYQDNPVIINGEKTTWSEVLAPTTQI